MRRGLSVWRGLGRFVVSAAIAVVGCGAPYPNALIDSEGNQIRLTAITKVLTDESLDDDQKKQALRDLGITDEELLNVLLTLGRP